MADALDLGSSAARRRGSSPLSRIPMKSSTYAVRQCDVAVPCAQIVAELWLFSFAAEPKPEIRSEFLQAVVPSFFGIVSDPLPQAL
jgi:hypothetical protein